MTVNLQSPIPNLQSPIPHRKPFLIAAFAAALCLLVALPAAGRAAPQTQPPILFVIVDALRSDHVSGYGYARETTPNLDAMLADQGARFVNATSTAPWTCPANTAMVTGRSPGRVGTNWHTFGTSIPADEVTLAELLHEAGYYAAGFASTYCIKGSLGFSQGFDHYDDTLATRPVENKARGAEVNARVFDWLDTEWTAHGGAQPLFLFVYYFDPHAWYDPLPPYDTWYDATYTGTVTPDVYGAGETVISGDLTLSPRDLQHVMALYDGEIRYWDEQLGALLEHLDGMGLLDQMLVVLTSDHGEMFGEHGKWVHGGSLYEEVLRVPLLVRYPGVVASRTISAPVQNMDLMPTILDFAGIPLPGNLQAVSLLPLLAGETPTATRPIFSEVAAITDPTHPLYWTAPRVPLRSMRANDWKLIHPLDGSGDALYALQAQSPYEGENLVQQEPERAASMQGALLDRFFPHRAYLPVMEGGE
jgi:arylsulfatase A-like enzyme